MHLESHPPFFSNLRFTFINTSRVGTAVQGVAAAELALQNSLWYCKDRNSMRALSGTKDESRIADPIIWHPAVRAMLLTMKAYAEGGRSMVRLDNFHTTLVLLVRGAL